MSKISVSMEKIEVLANESYYSCTMTNEQGVIVEILSYGATIRKWIIPTEKGTVDIVQGKDCIADYKDNSSCSSFIVGRFANRLANGAFTIDGKTTLLEKNQGNNTLHSASGNYAAKNWDLMPFVKEDRACVLCKLKDYGEGGFPGEAGTEVVYTLDNDGTLSVDYKFMPTAATPVNLTCHAYFNLNGHHTDSLENHLVQVNADAYLPGDSTGLPLGVIESVTGTDMDLRSFKDLNVGIASKFPQIAQFDGYDHNYCINGEGMRCVASAIGQKSGLRLDVYSELPGVQLYTTNIGVGEVKGKGGMTYHGHSAFCFETQFYPNAINVPAFKGKVCQAGETFCTCTEFRISKC